MRYLTSDECNFVSGSAQDDKIFTEAGVSVLAALGGTIGLLYGWGSTTYPIASPIGGLLIGAAVTPIATTLFFKGLIKVYEKTRVI